MASAEIRVEVVLAAGPQRVQRCEIVLPEGATAADALQASGLLEGLAADLHEALQLSCWGRACPPEVLLRDRDRLELTRPLQVDPKEARRARYRRDGLAKPVRARRR